MRRSFWGLCLSLAAAGSVSAAEPTVKVLVSGLDNPCGVALRPGSTELFVSDSAAGKICRVTGGDNVTLSPVVTGFKQDLYGKGPVYPIGPLGLAFLNENELVVGDGSLVDGAELVRVYEIPKAGETIPAEKMKQSLGPIVAGAESAKGEGNFYGVAVTPGAVYVTANGDDTKGWVLRSVRDGNKLGPLTPFLATKPAVEVDAPVGITISPIGQIVVSQMGEMNIPGDSLLTVYDTEGKLKLKAATGLHDIAAVAYSPKSGKLYAVDFAWVDNKQGGLFRLDVTGEGTAAKVTATKIVALDKPSAMAFAADGTLYVTVFGTAAEGDAKKPGKLLEIKGDL